MSVYILQFPCITDDNIYSAESTIDFHGELRNTSGFELESIGNDLVIGNIRWSWGGSEIATQIVLDASGLFGAIASGIPSIGDIIDQSSCATLACATPASSDAVGYYPIDIGPAPISTTSYNTTGQSSGYLTTIDMLSLGTDDGIGGSPMNNGPFENLNFNYDFTNIIVTGVSDPSAVPLPAAVWLFSFGVIALSGMARCRKT